MSDKIVYLISGANRGIGFSLVKQLATDSSNIIFAGARTPSNAIALHDLAKTSKADIRVIELVSADIEGNKKAAKEVKDMVGRVDVVIANAGISDPEAWGPVHETDPSQWMEHYKVNVLGVVILYQSFHSLLLASTVVPKLIVVSSAGGSNAFIERISFPFAIYNTSKAAVNYVTGKIHAENENTGLIAFPLHPGMVSSDMGNIGVSHFFPPGTENPFSHMGITPDESAEAIVKIVNEATRETHGGKFINYDGTIVPW